MGAPLRILMVEDIPTDAELNASELRRIGLSFEWRRVETREELLSALEDLHPDIVLCDYSLPGFSAPEALGLLRERAPDLPVVIVTGTQDEETAVECMRMGAWDYVLKEHLVRLGPAVHRALERAGVVRTRKRAEEELRSSEARFRLLIESIPDALVVSDREGRIQMVNARAEAMFGYTRHELIGHTVEALIPEVLRGRHLSHDTMSSAALGLHLAAPSLDLRARRKDGSELPVEINWSPIETANDLLVISAIRDVTEQRRAAEEIAAQRRFLREVIDVNPNFVFAKDRLGRFTLANKAVADAYGTTPEALIGKSDADLNPNVEEVEHFRRDDLEVLETGRDKFILEERITDATGQERWLQTVKRAIGPVGGTATYVLGVATDITERKKLEIQLIQAQKLEAIGQLAGGVAHDFNNLLTVILGRCALVLGSLPPDASPRRDIDLIQKTADRAVALTRQLLAFSRKQILEPKVLDLDVVVPGIATMLQRLIGEDIELVFRPGAELGRVKADPGQIEQVIMNLAVNARDAMPDGGRITIETGNVELGDEYARQHVGVQPGPYVLLAVSDTGTGMDSATQARIFEPFFTTKAPGKGTGLGLSTVYGIVKQSGGNIWVYSEPGRGTTFKVYLPRVENTAEPVQVIRPAPGRGTESILLVEDEEAVRALAREVLEGYGYTVFEARDVADAMLIAERHTGPIHLLVTDVVMPQMSGRALAERLASLRQEMKVGFMEG
ncbi:MAG: PAS domain S-box protein [Candidatus Rokubacteria bacterium]|nr:PAS domain S-box protein [Candidatus Rokubacteria bacterium]